MEQRLNFVTLAVADVEQSVSFYRDGLGWTPTLFVPGEVAFFDVAHGVTLSLWNREQFAAEVVAPGDGVTPITLAHNVSSAAEVDGVLADAAAAGAVVRAGQYRDWGGYSGYFSDPDGFWWEVAHNPTPHGVGQVSDSRDWLARYSLTPQAVAAELKSREPVFHREPLDADRDHFYTMTTDDFYEVGASGAIYSRAQVADLMAERYASGERDGDDAWQVSDFGVRELAPGLWQAHYHLDQRGRRTRRSTLWLVTPDGWRVTYHQATITA